MEINLTDEEIAIRAYGIWEQNGYPYNTHEQDWFQAMEELRNEAVSPEIATASTASSVPRKLPAPATSKSSKIAKAAAAG